MEDKTLEGEHAYYRRWITNVKPDEKKMLALHPEYIIDKYEHKKSVVLPFNEWEMLISNIEELDDIKAFDAAKADNDVTIPFEQAVAEIRQNTAK